MTQATKTRLVSIFLAFVLGICAVITTAAQTPLVARAESITYSGVLDDLKKDTSFKPENYPTKADDYSLQIIQLAESVNKELFVYVYQPSGKTKNFKASSINISTTINDSISYHNYKLEFLSSSGVFYKYKVVGVTVKDDAARYYAISSIYRPFDESIDKQASGGNTVTEVNYAVNKQYCFGEINGKPYVNCVDIETIVVTDKFVGFVRYKDGFKLYVGACDSHFVAFNTDKPIDKLLEADVYYTTQSYDWSSAPFVGVKETFGDKADKYAYLKYTDKVEHTGGGLFAGTYKWDRIQTIDDFIKGENRENIYHGAVLDVKTSSKLTDEALIELKGKKWVLRFAETSYSLSGYSTTGSTFESYTLVGDVTILRLKFETDGITYNLGVIDNKQSGSKDPSNETDVDISLNKRGKMILYLLKMMCHRRNWKYVGVWERSPEKKRLHFHGLFYIPDGAMVGELIEVHDYSPIKKKVQHTIQNTYFNERFGRSDFKPVEDRRMLGEAVAYLTKYMEKTGEKIVYSKGLPQYFISDILDEDVVCTIGQEDRKLLLYDNFNCWDEGCLVGPVSKEVIAQMRKSN